MAEKWYNRKVHSAFATWWMVGAGVIAGWLGKLYWGIPIIVFAVATVYLAMFAYLSRPKD